MSVIPRYGVDQLQCRLGMLFGYGWLFFENQELLSLSMDISIDNGLQIVNHVIEIHDKRQRNDVAAHFSSCAEHALNSGWLIYARIPEGVVRHVSLNARAADGSNFRLSVPCSQESDHDLAVTDFDKRKAKVWSVRARKFFTLLISGHWRALMQKSLQHFRGVPLSSVSTLQELQRLLRDKKSPERWVLFLDHELGGGANKYRNERIQSLLAEGYGVMTLTYQINILTDILIVDTPGCNRRYRLSDMAEVLNWIDRLSVVRLIYNNAVSLAQPLKVIDALMMVRVRSGIPLEVCVHDYFPICPSQHLINHRGTYCGVPDISECQKCLMQNKRSFVPVYAHIPIEHWRDKWLRVLLASDEVRVFSDSSIKLLERAFPSLIGTGNVCKVPHQVNEPKLDLKKNLSFERIHLGVVGNINHEKGSGVVQELVRFLDSFKKNVRVTLLGAIDVPVSAAVFEDAGSYPSGGLKDRLIESGINVCLIPSICPETFSYVCQELINLGMPVTCFNIGAPPERVMNYKYGHVLQSMPTDPVASIWKEVEDFYERLYFQ